MNLYNTIIVTLLTFTICNVLLLIYPLTFTRTQMKEIVRKTQYSFLIVTVLILFIIFIGTKQDISHILTGMNSTSILMIISGLITCLGILFIICSLLLMKINNKDTESLEKLQQIIELSIFSSKNMQEQLKSFAFENIKILSDYGIKHLLDLFIKQYSEMNKPPLDLGQFLLKRCLETISVAKQFIPIPFPHINILFSLSGVGVLITLIISLISQK